MKVRTLSTTGSTRGTAYTMSNKILTRDGKTHVVWLDQICKTCVQTYHHKTGRWGKPVFVGEGDDNHAGAAFAMDSKGYLHLVYGPHHNPIQHAVSRRPNIATTWVAQPRFGGSAATYPSLVCDGEDRLHACYRGAFEDELPRSLMYQRRPKSGDWIDPVKLVDPEGPAAYTQFENALYLDHDGTLYLAYHIVRATQADPRDTRGRGFGVMRSRDEGASWETVGGEALTLPTTPSSACVIEFDEGLDVRMGNLVCDSRGNPYFTLNRKEGEVHETFLYRWRDDAWEPVSLLAEAEKLCGPCMMSDVCSLSVSERNVLYAAAAVCKRGGGWADPTNEIVLFTSRDLGDTFSGYRISPEDPAVSSWLPGLEWGTGHNKVEVPHLIYTHGDKGEGCSPDVNTQIRCVSLAEIAKREEQAVKDAFSGLLMLSGVSYPDERREEIWDWVERNRGNYRRLRAVDVGYDVEPPTVFRPGKSTAPPQEQRTPFAWGPTGAVSRPEADEDLAFLPVSGLARLIESRQVSPVELTRLYLDRCTTYGPHLHCIVTLAEDLALEQARQAESEIVKGTYRGPLHGIPWGAKDLLATRGMPTTWGATPFEEQVIDTDATVVTRLREAGAVLVAKLSLGALANGPNWFGGTTRNPWKVSENSSGSSAGPGSATAAGLVGFSIGSETNGSIVGPSYTCGVVGLRPTYGRVSRYGAMALSWTMDKLGPMCRGVEDCAAVLDAIYGPDGRDPSVADAPFQWTPEVDLAGLRIGYLAPEFEGLKDDEERPLYEAVLDVLRSLGADPQPAALPDYPYSAMQVVLQVEAGAAFDDLTRSGAVDAMTERDQSRWPKIFRVARAVPAVDYLRAQRVRALLMRDMEALMAKWDVLVGLVFRGNNGNATNLTGHPSVTVPCGFVKGMPRGILFIGRLYDEATLLRVARAYEQATDWHDRHPDLEKVTDAVE